jgi:hypothetical protein
MATVDLGALRVQIVAENDAANKAINDTGKAIDNMAKKSSKTLDT